ncbi:MAG: tetratricopeptide repeat protein [Spirochaetaceae bacterium]|nr:tetratricopeptide repeat protein [Spirochaetaceae bacterium]
MANRKILILFLILSFISNSCSSLPGKKDLRSLEIKNKAVKFQKDGISQFNAGRYKQALDFFNIAFLLSASIDNEEGLVLTLNSIGRTKLAESENEEAYESFSKALIIAERLGDSLLIMKTIGNLADYYIMTGDLDRAFSLLTDSLEEADGIKSTESAYLAHTLSLVFRKRGEYDESLEYLNKSLTYNLKNNAFRALASDYYMMASIYSLQLNYNEALHFAQEALKYDKMIEYSQGIAADLEALAIISGKMGNTEISEIYLNRSIAVLNAINNVNELEVQKLDPNNDLVQ